MTAQYAVQTASYPAAPINSAEIMRYAGVREETDELSALLDKCLLETDGKLAFRVCFAEVPVNISSSSVDMGFFESDSALLCSRLSGCESAIVFAGTVGIELDRLIKKYSRISPSRALFFQAIGAERIESLCDAFCSDTERKKSAEGKYVTARFSPGYGDIPLDMQRSIFSLLNPERNIGLTLNESLLMSPSKSVTAMIGVTSKSTDKRPIGCNSCQKHDCAYRRNR